MRPFFYTFAAVLALSPLVEGAAIVRSAVTTGGAGDVTFNGVINQFRTDLGGALNPPGACAPTPCVAGRREINWDAVPAGSSSPNNFPGDFFNGTNGVQPAGRQRGANFTTPGTGFRVSATDFSDEAPAFGPAEFAAFSPARLFATLGSPILDVTFAVPGSPAVNATVNGFGVIFSDVDYTGSATIEYFDINGASLGLFDVAGVFPTPNGQNASESFSVLGVTFDAGERVARVRITSGTHGIDGNFVGLDDAVVMDDFIYGEPLANEVPEPSTFISGGAGLLALVALRRRRRQ
ncbi:MAG: PEP-CTERM sorting domain-containing protein [Bryobacterales bacterium]|nr:PEP-CTERM sorting domain-containing protein [Bryobacterales bacterium]